jgi:hypothetical protein
MDFHEIDLTNPTLTLKIKFASIQLFREAVREYNVWRGNDIKFHEMKDISVLQSVGIHHVDT